MTPDQYRAAIAALGLNVGTGAAFLGLSRRSSTAYASGEWPIPRATAMLLALMVELALKPDDVARLVPQLDMVD